MSAARNVQPDPDHVVGRLHFPRLDLPWIDGVGQRRRRLRPHWTAATDELKPGFHATYRTGRPVPFELQVRGICANDPSAGDASFVAPAKLPTCDVP
jgi:hypothetical protein